MSRTPDHDCHPQRRFPRVSGDEPTGKQAIADVYEFSPRERG